MGYRQCGYHAAELPATTLPPSNPPSLGCSPKPLREPGGHEEWLCKPKRRSERQRLPVLLATWAKFVDSCKHECILILSKNKTVTWFKQKEYLGGLRIEKGMPLSINSMAYHAEPGVPDLKAEAVETEAWIAENYHGRGIEVREQSWELDGYFCAHFAGGCRCLKVLASSAISPEQTILCPATESSAAASPAFTTSTLATSRPKEMWAIEKLRLFEIIHIFCAKHEEIPYSPQSDKLESMPTA